MSAVFPDGAAKPPQLDWAQVKDLGRNNGVWYPCAVRAYMAHAGGEQEVKGEGKKLFYAKKLPPAVQDMLVAEHVSSEALWGGGRVPRFRRIVGSRPREPRQGTRCSPKGRLRPCQLEYITGRT